MLPSEFGIVTSVRTSVGTTEVRTVFLTLALLFAVPAHRRLQRTQKNTVTYKSGSCLYRSTYHPVKPPIRVDPPPMRLPPQQQVVYG